jgi:phage gp29-like protein
MAAPKGWDPPPGTTVFSMEDAVKSINEQAGPNGIAQDDAGFTQFDPLKQPGRKATASIVYREIPFIQLQSHWTVRAVTAALHSNLNGIFETVAQLWESIRGDDRVTATLGSRTAGLFGRDVRHTPANDSKAAREVCDAWAECWPEFAGGPALRTISEYAIGLGWAPAQLVWDTSTDVWKPRAKFWNNRYTYWHWGIRRYVALSQDGQIPIEPGDGKWLLHSHYDPYRAWIFGAVRAVAEPWLLRHYAFRDMARYSEVHGLPIRIAETPASADATERSQYAQQVATLGTETTLLLGKGVDEQNSYGFRLEEAKDPSWEVFSALIGQCDMAIVLALNFQNLTTEVNTGSFAAVQGHMDIRQNGIQSDNAAWKYTLRNQVIRPFALFNFGDPDLAPTTEWDVTPLDQLDAKVKRFQTFMTGIEVGRRGGWEFEDEEAARDWASRNMGFDGIPKFKITDPVAAGMGDKDASKLPFTPVDPAQVVKVNEAREMNGLPKIDGGDVTIAEYHADKDADRTKDVTEAGAASKEAHAPPPPPAAPGAPGQEAVEEEK